MRLLLQQAAAVAAAALLSATVLAALVSPTAASGAAALVPCPNNCSAIGTCNEAEGTCDCPYEYSWSVDCSQTRLELMDMDAFNIYRWVVVGLDAAVAALILGLLGTVVIITGKLGRPTVQAGAYIFLLLAFASRVVYYSLDPGGFYQEFDPWLDRLLKYIFYPFIFTAYTMVLYFWASSYFRKNHGRLEVMRRLRLIFVSFIVAMYLVELAFTTLQYAFEDEERFSREQVTLWYQLYLAVILLFISSAFLYYGYRIYTQLRAVAPHANAGLRSLRQVTILTVLTALCFIAGILFSLIIWLLDTQSTTWYIASDGVVQGLSLISGMLILKLLGRPRRLRPWDDSEYLIRGDEKLPILAAPTNGDSEYFPDDS